MQPIVYFDCALFWCWKQNKLGCKQKKPLHIVLKKFAIYKRHSVKIHSPVTNESDQEINSEKAEVQLNTSRKGTALRRICDEKDSVEKDLCRKGYIKTVCFEKGHVKKFCALGLVPVHMFLTV